VLLAGGGSGGHVFPALAVGEELGRRGWRVSFAGDPRGMEKRLVEGRGVEFVPLAARPLVGRGAAGRLLALATTGRSALAARRWLRRSGVDVVVGTGGYASAPAALGAALARRPLLLIEPNARPGAANRWLSRFAAAAAVGWESAAAGLRCPARVTGVPVRAAFATVPALAPEAAPRLLALGGSQGSRRLNQLLPGAVAAARRRVPALAVVHQCGERLADEARAAWAAAGDPPGVEVVPFVADVAGALAGASLVVSRAGAITLAEIAAAGRPAVLLPLALAGAHQADNARAFETAGAGRVIEESGADAGSLGALLGDLLAAPAGLAAMGARARALARPGAAAAIADEAERVARRAAP
jgi:UDP-N-acetylglucosamine--N-acetylmuramyl-(pentapeptide) pyrophosphoryl-undecaprenol N-acetylglucosamine transferase